MNQQEPKNWSSADISKWASNLNEKVGTRIRALFAENERLESNLKAARDEVKRLTYGDDSIEDYRSRCGQQAGRSAALLLENARLRKERDAARKIVIIHEENLSGPYCSYCGDRFPGAKWEDLHDHIMACDHHPLPKMIAERDAAVGALRKLMLRLDDHFGGPLRDADWAEQCRAREILSSITPPAYTSDGTAANSAPMAAIVSNSPVDENSSAHSIGRGEADDQTDAPCAACAVVQKAWDERENYSADPDGAHGPGTTLRQEDAIKITNALSASPEVLAVVDGWIMPWEKLPYGGEDSQICIYKDRAWPCNQETKTPSTPVTTIIIGRKEGE